MIPNYDQEIERMHEPAIVLPDPPEPESEVIHNPCVIHADRLHHFKFRGSDLPMVCECGAALVN